MYILLNQRCILLTVSSFVCVNCDELCNFAAFKLPSLSNQELHETLYDHRSLELNPDDYERVCQIPKRKVCCIC